MTGYPSVIHREQDLTSLASVLTAEGPVTSTSGVADWLDHVNERVPLRVERVPLRHLDRWRFLPDPLRLAHDSGRFFSIEGIRTQTDWGPVPQWDQPIIRQPEIGILGLLTKVTHGVRYYLIQAKVEPGNINGAQLSPTLQATRSNFTKVHRGRQPRYLEYFTGERNGRIIVDQLQSEQGSRFLGKRNRNMVVEPEDPIEADDEFRWMTLGQIKNLLRKDNVVNMDARSVLSCIPLPPWEVLPLGPKLTDFGLGLLDSARTSTRSAHPLPEILNWYSMMRASYDYRVEPRGLDRIENWRILGEEIRHCEGRYFSVIGVRVAIGNREVAEWSQPLLHHPGEGLNGMVTQRIDGVLHFLIRACFYPGNRDMFELGSTVSRSDYAGQFGRPDAPPFLDLFRDPDPSHVRYSTVQSEEGGRFYRYQNRYTILEVPAGTIGRLPPGFVWMTLGQIYQLMPHGYFNIEARNLIACLHLM